MATPYSAPTRQIGDSGLTTDLLAAYKQIEGLGKPAPRAVYVTSTGNDSTALFGVPAFPYATIAAALAGLGAAGGVVNIGTGDFAAPPASAIASNTSFRGSGKPVFDAYYIISPSNEIYFSAPPTKLVGGTVLKGTFDCSLKDNIKVLDLGVDVGSAWCAASNGGKAAEGLLFAQAYNLSGGVTSYDGIHTDQGDSRQRYGIVAHNITCLCKEATAPVHAALFENLVGPFLTNITTAFGIHGIVLKTAGGLASNLQAFGHTNNGLILKANSYAYQQHTQISNITVACVVPGDGGGIRFTDGDESANSVVYNLDMAHFKVVGTSFGLISDGPSIDGLTIHDGTVSFCTGDGVNLSNLANSSMHHVTARGCGGVGIAVQSVDRNTEVTALKSLGNGSGMRLSAAQDCQLDVFNLTALSNQGVSIDYASNDRIHVHGMIKADTTPTGTPTLVSITAGGGIPVAGGGPAIGATYKPEDFSYLGNWQDSGPAAGTFSGHVFFTQTAGDTATVTVNIPPGGGRLAIIQNRAPAYGPVTLLVDGQTSLGSFNPYAGSAVPADENAPVYITPFISEGPHPFTIKNGSTGICVVDAVRVVAP